MKAFLSKPSILNVWVSAVIVAAEYFEIEGGAAAAPQVSF